jgi:hypothetical protein
MHVFRFEDPSPMEAQPLITTAAPRTINITVLIILISSPSPQSSEVFDGLPEMFGAPNRFENPWCRISGHSSRPPVALEIHSVSSLHDLPPGFGSFVPIAYRVPRPASIYDT